MSTSSTASVPYTTFDTPTPSSPTGMASTSSCAFSSGNGLLFGPASEAVAAALGLGPHPQHWEAEACALSHEEVARRLRASDLGGLTEPIMRALGALNAAAARNERPATPTLPPESMDDGPPTPSMARQPLSSRSSTGDAPSPSRVQRLVPVVERMHGRVPRSEEKWQYFEGESGVMGCLRAFRLVCYNLSGTLICFRAYTDNLRRVA